ncbi:hypothetical protein FHS44_003864 [Streptosporangium saharense]|uniref:Uncharacterized protein n=1 Tax=Streptosporangium saharense TaxID=1706840 RepID=A0A7W7QNC8_9ACTN|nr:hypothetical protein [Streptosporangium saharense]
MGVAPYEECDSRHFTRVGREARGSLFAQVRRVIRMFTRLSGAVLPVVCDEKLRRLTIVMAC